MKIYKWKLINSKKAVLALLFFISILSQQSCLTDTTYESGRKLYNVYCSNCHGSEGEGYKALYPPIQKSPTLIANPGEVLCYSVYGKRDGTTIDGVVYDLDMPAIEHDLSPSDLSNLMNYIVSKWGDSNIFFSPAVVDSILSECLSKVERTMDTGTHPK